MKDWRDPVDPTQHLTTVLFYCVENRFAEYRTTCARLYRYDSWLDVWGWQLSIIGLPFDPPEGCKASYEGLTYHARKHGAGVFLWRDARPL